MDLLSTYSLIRSGLEDRELPEPLEPFEHVNEVEELRIAFRPTNTRLLLFAESHVRVTDEYFADRGAGFIYNHHYYTPWWNDLLLPALSTREVQKASLTEHARLVQLLNFQRLGFWVVDASIIALSGYKKLGKHFEGRPFDGLKGAVIQDSWEYVGPIVDKMLNQAQPPVICYFQTVDFVLPEEVRKKSTALKFCGASGFLVGSRSGTVRVPGRTVEWTASGSLRLSG
jgi:hypothetical protein